MKIYNDYLNKIEKALKEGKKETATIGFAGYHKPTEYFEKSIKETLSESKSSKLLPSLETFAEELGISPNYSQKLGSHPDFIHLKNNDNFEKHYIISMFIDIKNSTNLFRKYYPETVFIVTNTIQKAAIHTSLIFGGYIHRLQGDGLFVYFGGKSIDEKKSVLLALRAASVFTYFVKNDLKRVFTQEGIENIFTRIGIDFGSMDDVLWANAGIGDISEITTCSLHTSLAAKMQARAESNGIVVGDNIIDKVDFSDLFTSVSKRTGEEKDRYIFRNQDENFNYGQYDFNWYKFLQKQDFIASDFAGELTIKSKMPQIYNYDNLRPIAVTSKPFLK